MTQEKLKQLKELLSEAQDELGSVDHVDVEELADGSCHLMGIYFHINNGSSTIIKFVDGQRVEEEGLIIC